MTQGLFLFDVGELSKLSFLCRADTVRLCLDRLLPLQNSLNEFEVKIRETHVALNDVLRSDEDMSEMYLTTKLETGK